MRSLPLDLFVPEYAPGTRYDSTVDDPANPKAKKTHGKTLSLWFLPMRLATFVQWLIPNISIRLCLFSSMVFAGLLRLPRLSSHSSIPGRSCIKLT